MMIINIQHPASPYFVMPSFIQLRELARYDYDYFKKFVKEYREYNYE